MMRAWAIATAIVALATGCENTEEGFACGRYLQGSTSDVRRCDRFTEVCICRTGKCAQLDAPRDGGGCPSSYRYVDPPFGPSDNPGACVPESDVAWRVAQESEGILCRVPADGGEDGGNDAGDAR